MCIVIKFKCFFGTTAAYALTAFGGGNGSIFIDNARCTGNEQRLEDCVHNGIGNHDCSLDHSNDAGVFCDTSNSPHKNYVHLIFLSY